MIPDKKFIEETFNLYNRLIFNSALPLPRFVLRQARTFHGKLVYHIDRRGNNPKPTDFEMRISLSYDLDRKEWEDVVIHEMIHQHIAFHGLRDTSPHGAVFKKLMDSINRTYSRNITVSARSTADEHKKTHVDNRRKAHYVCIIRFSDGRYGIAPVAKSCLFGLWDLNKYFPQVAAIKWIASISTFFNSFPHVRKPKLYIVGKEDLLKALAGAYMLERNGQIIRPLIQRKSPAELLP